MCAIAKVSPVSMNACCNTSQQVELERRASVAKACMREDQSRQSLSCAGRKAYRNLQRLCSECQRRSFRIQQLAGNSNCSKCCSLHDSTSSKSILAWCAYLQVCSAAGSVPLTHLAAKCRDSVSSSDQVTTASLRGACFTLTQRRTSCIQTRTSLLPSCICWAGAGLR